MFYSRFSLISLSTAVVSALAFFPFVTTTATDNHNHSEEQQHNTSNTHQGLKDGTLVELEHEILNSIGLQLEKVPQSGFTLEKTLYGQLTVPPHHTLTYILPAAGRVTFHVKAAESVKKGDLLYTVKSPDVVDAWANANEAQSTLDRLTVELNTLKQRQQQLQAIGNKNSELDTSILFKEAELKSQAITLANSKRRLSSITAGGELKDTELLFKAESDGIVQSINMSQNAWGEQGTTVLAMARNNSLEFSSTLYAGDTIAYNKAQLVVNNGHENIRLDGELRVDDQVDPATQSRKIYFTSPNLPTTAYAGQLARLDLYAGLERNDKYIPIPNSAVIRVGIENVVFVQVNDHSFAAKKVQIKPARMGKTPVLGLIPGQTIVTKGGYELKYLLPSDGSDADKRKAGHFHADGVFHEAEDH